MHAASSPFSIELNHLAITKKMASALRLLPLVLMSLVVSVVAAKSPGRPLFREYIGPEGTNVFAEVPVHPGVDFGSCGAGTAGSSCTSTSSSTRTRPPRRCHSSSATTTSRAAGTTTTPAAATALGMGRWCSWDLGRTRQAAGSSPGRGSSGRAARCVGRAGCTASSSGPCITLTGGRRHTTWAVRSFWRGRPVAEAPHRWRRSPLHPWMAASALRPHVRTLLYVHVRMDQIDFARARWVTQGKIWVSERSRGLSPWLR
jgi:hypothetical protein